MLKYLLFLSGMSFWLQGHAQTFQTKNFSIEEGLPMATVTSMAEDHYGYLWVGMYGGGIAFFDGKRFTVRTETDGLLNNVVNDLIIDSDNQVWVGSLKGVTRYDGFKFENHVLEPSSVGYGLFELNDTIFAYQSQSKRIYAFSKSGKLLSAPTYFDSVGKIVSIVKVDKEIYLLNERQELMYRKGGKFETISAESILGLTCVGDMVCVITNRGYQKVEAASIEPGIFFDSNGLLLNRDSAGYVWSYGNKELVSELSVDPAKKWKLPLENTPALFFVDSEMNRWVSTLDQGLIKIFEPTFTKVCLDDRLEGKFVVRIHEDADKNLWIGTLKDGLGIYKEGKALQHFMFTEPGKNGIREIEAGNDDYTYVAAFNGLAKVHKKSFQWQWISDTLKVHRIKKAFDGTLWVALQSGSFGYLKNDIFVPIATMHDIDGWIWDFKYSSLHNSIFLVTDNSQLLQFDGKNFKTIPIENFQGSIFLTVGFWKDRVLVGTDGKGIAVVSIDGNEIHYLNRKIGLSSDMVNFADADSRGLLWVATLFGIDVVSLEDDGRVNSIEHYSRSHGLSGIKPHRNAYFFGQDSVNYFGVVDNVYKTTLPSNEPSRFPLHVHSVYVGDSLIVNTSRLRLSHTKNILTYHFAKINKTSNDRFVYRYELNGERIASSDSTTGVLSLGGLPPGKFALTVKAIDRGKVVDELTTSIELVPLFYQTVLFKIFVFVTLIFLILLSFYRKYKQKIRANRILEEIRLQENNRLRKEIGRDFHDEMGNQLARIINYVGMLRMSNKLDTSILEKTEYSAKYLLNGTKDFIWAIDPMNDNLFNLFVHLKDFGDKLLSEKNIEFEVHYLVYRDVPLPHGSTRQLNLIFKEALTNAFKHSQASLIVLEFKLTEDDRVQITLNDNGMGFRSTDMVESPDGLTNMRKRAERIGADFMISSGTPTGVVISVLFKKMHYV